MLFFDYLHNLDQHLALLQKRIKTKQSIFLVGGCVRDPLLGLEKKPIDIDFTMAGKPEEIYAAIDKKGMSHFITEKFGTITLITKGQGGRGRMKNKNEVKYELTPLRTEGDYEDFRHPGEITRSNDVLLDSQRRDFTINCMYYTNIPYKAEYTKLLSTKNIHTYSDDETFLKRLDDHGYLFIKNSNTLIVQDHKHIAKLFAEGTVHPDHLLTMLKSATVFTLKKEKNDGKLQSPEKSGKIENGKLRIIVDPHKGIHDSIHRKLRAVGEPDKRFGEDALRIVRAVRFVNVLNEKLKHGKMEKLKNLNKEIPVILFDFNKETRNSLKKNHALVNNVAKERIKEEIMKAFTVGDPFGFIALLDEAELLEHLFPALYGTKNVDQPIRYHPFDIFTHTLLCLFELQKINADPLVRLAMLYHDVGKVEQFGAYQEGLSKEEIRAILAGPLNHRKSSPEYAKRDFKALGFSSKEIALISLYIANHHKPEEMLFIKEEKVEKKVRTFFSEVGYEVANNILDIAIADRLGQYNPLQNSADISDVYTLKDILKKLQKKEGQFTMKDLAIDGGDIMREFNLKASPIIGTLLKKALARVINDIKTRNTKKEIFTFLGVQLKQIKK